MYQKIGEWKMKAKPLFTKEDQEKLSEIAELLKIVKEKKRKREVRERINDLVNS